MKVAKFIAAIGLIAMTIVLLYAFTKGDFTGEGSLLLSMPWGIVSMVDLYVGFILFSCWIIYREKAWLPASVWVLLMMILGFWAGSLYTILALLQSKGNWKKFWLGNRMD